MKYQTLSWSHLSINGFDYWDWTPFVRPSLFAFVMSVCERVRACGCVCARMYGTRKD